MAGGEKAHLGSASLHSPNWVTFINVADPIVVMRTPYHLSGDPRQTLKINAIVFANCPFHLYSNARSGTATILSDAELRTSPQEASGCEAGPRLSQL